MQKSGSATARTALRFCNLIRDGHIEIFPLVSSLLILILRICGQHRRAHQQTGIAEEMEKDHNETFTSSGYDV